MRCNFIGASLFLVMAACFLSSCSQSPAPKAGITDDIIQIGTEGDENLESGGTFTVVYKRTLAVACVECHNPSGMATVNYNVQLNFADRAAAYTTLLASTVNGVTSTGICGPVRIVNPGNPKLSYLLGTLIQNYGVPDFGGVPNCVPYSGHFQMLNLSAEQKANLVSWIQGGALDN